MFPRLKALLALPLCWACGAEAPPGLECPGQIRIAADSAELSAALAAAVDGDCVGLESGVYTGPFAITSGIGLGPVAEAEVNLVATAETIPLTIRAADVTVTDLDLTGPSLIALQINAAPVTINAVDLANARRAAVEIRCEEQGCLTPNGQVLLAGVAISGSNNGVILDGARLRAEGCRVEGSTTQSLSGGIGLVATGSAHVELISTNFTDNDYGLIVDGAGTTAILDGTTVQGSRERGVWAQGLRGTIGAPSLSVGNGSRLANNRVVGLGSIDSQGLAIRDSQLVDTVLTRISINVVETAEIGDGLGLFAQSGDVVVERSVLTGNGRAQAVVDRGGANLNFGNNQIDGALKLVVQATASPVVAPAGDLSTPPMPLPIAANPITLP
ncbi:MAG: right-handed parallel beta-helix repeat-containing protein [Deltaproteobacteria bacterium]|jgi:hypothetical protein|nr:right-handed parallel beta-helix repeat-containing protein [Deltaproteobacteria bacterium]